MKTVVVYAIGATVGIVAAGAYLRWAVTPCLIAFWAGRQVGRINARKTPAG